MEASAEKNQQVQKTKSSTIASAGWRLGLIFGLQIFVLWLVAKWYPDVTCSALASVSCKPEPTTERLIIQLFVPAVFIPLALIQVKQIIMLAGALPKPKRWLTVFVCGGALLFMAWQFLSAVGALLGRWFG
jgi:hypothetical protein